jgi:CRP-like cAMP-binding protein
LHLLQQAALLEDFTPAEADILGAVLLRVRAHPGQVLMAEGSVGHWMLLVISGSVDVTKRLPARPGEGPAGEGVSRMAVVREGAALGEMSMLDGAPRYATCTAIEPVEAGVLTRAAIAMLIREHPAVGAKLLVKITQLLAQRLRNTSNQLARLLQKNND